MGSIGGRHIRRGAGQGPQGQPNRERHGAVVTVLCLSDERFLNLWIRDCPFKLDRITDLPRYVAPGHFQISFDDKSGYDHVRLHPSSSTFLGCNGEDGVLFTLPFLLAGKRAPSCTRRLVWRLLTMCIRLEFRVRSISIIDTWAS